MPNIFDSNAFKSFTYGMINHINHSKYDESNDIVIKRVLPGINSKISTNNRHIRKVKIRGID